MGFLHASRRGILTRHLLLPLRSSTNQPSVRSKRSWRLFICTRHPHVRPISSSSNLHATATATASEYIPFPTHPRPTPHQIFHLPQTATDAEIKSRCEWGWLTFVPNHYYYYYYSVLAFQKWGTNVRFTFR